MASISSSDRKISNVFNNNIKFKALDLIHVVTTRRVNLL